MNHSKKDVHEPSHRGTMFWPTITLIIGVVGTIGSLIHLSIIL